MATVRPTLSRPAKRPAYISAALKSATHVFVRRDSHRYPLDAPYDGPFPVAARTEKTITIRRHQRDVVITIDGCKPVFMDDPPRVVPRTF